MHAKARVSHWNYRGNHSTKLHIWFLKPLTGSGWCLRTQRGVMLFMSSSYDSVWVSRHEQGHCGPSSGSLWCVSMDRFILCQMKVPSLWRQNFILVLPDYAKKQAFDSSSSWKAAADMRCVCPSPSFLNELWSVFPIILKMNVQRVGFLALNLPITRLPFVLLPFS